MKVRLWSDIHEEFGTLFVNKREDDKDTVLVIAGDFDVGWSDASILRRVELCNQFKAVIEVPGNHSYYGQKIQEVDGAYTRLMDEIPNYHYLNPGIAIVDGVRFVGGILWTDYNNGDWRVMQEARDRMNDYRKIAKRIYIESGKAVSRSVSPQDILCINREQRQFIRGILEVPFAGKTVVVTHHAPLMMCAAADGRFANGGVMDYMYANTGLESWFEELKFDFWFHGHIHAWQEHDINGRRIISRPRGYHDYEELAVWYENNQADAMVIDLNEESNNE